MAMDVVCIEDLPTELWFTIFRFLTRDQLLLAFTQLNSRFDSLLSSPHLFTVFRVKIYYWDTYPSVRSLQAPKNLQLEWIQALDSNKRVPGACMIQFLRYQASRLVNLRSLNIYMRAKHASKNLEYLSKALSQLHSVQVFKLQCEPRYVDRIVSVPLAQLFQTILRLPSLRYCTLNLWYSTRSNFDYETITHLPSNQSIEYLHVPHVDQVIVSILLNHCHGLKSLITK